MRASLKNLRFRLRGQQNETGSGESMHIRILIKIVEKRALKLL